VPLARIRLRAIRQQVRPVLVEEDERVTGPALPPLRHDDGRHSPLALALREQTLAFIGIDEVQLGVPKGVPAALT
jgi:hypothetical protein